jgi:hypothetical protein
LVRLLDFVVRLEVLDGMGALGRGSGVRSDWDVQNCAILDSPYYVFVALCIVVIVVSLIKIAASNENIECFRKYFAVGYRASDPSLFLKFLHRSGQKISHLEYQ